MSRNSPLTTEQSQGILFAIFASIQITLWCVWFHFKMDDVRMGTVASVFLVLLCVTVGVSVSLLSKKE